MSYRSNVISSDDPQALEKLQAKLEACENKQQSMKEINKYFRKNGTCVGYPNMTEATARKLDESVKRAYSWEKQPFPSYELTNNNAEIRRLKQRIDLLAQQKETGLVGWDFSGGTVKINQEINRLQIIFDEKPDEQQRAILKSNGFHWSPREGAWQRQLNYNAVYAASRVDFIRPESGENPLNLQPKPKAKNEPQR